MIAILARLKQPLLNDLAFSVRLIGVQEAIVRCLKIAYERNTSAAIRDLRKRLT